MRTRYLDIGVACAASAAICLCGSLAWADTDTNTSNIVPGIVTIQGFAGGQKLPCLFYETFPGYSKGAFFCPDTAFASQFLATVLSAKATGARINLRYNYSSENQPSPVNGATASVNKVTMIWMR